MFALTLGTETIAFYSHKSKPNGASGMKR